MDTEQRKTLLQIVHDEVEVLSENTFMCINKAKEGYASDITVVREDTIVYEYSDVRQTMIGKLVAITSGEGAVICDIFDSASLESLMKRIREKVDILTWDGFYTSDGMTYGTVHTKELLYKTIIFNNEMQVIVKDYASIIPVKKTSTKYYFYRYMDTYTAFHNYRAKLVCMDNNGVEKISIKCIITNIYNKWRDIPKIVVLTYRQVMDKDGFGNWR